MVSDVVSGRYALDQHGELFAHLHGGGVNSGYFERRGRARIDATSAVIGNESESLDVQSTQGKMRWSAAFGGVMEEIGNVGHVPDGEFCGPDGR